MDTAQKRLEVPLTIEHADHNDSVFFDGIRHYHCNSRDRPPALLPPA
jgi:hypothetical protein